MVMDPRTHMRGTAPDFTLPKANPSAYQTDALWWLVQMRLKLAPGSANGGTYANKPGSHNIGRQLPTTDHSLNPANINRVGPWWKDKCSAHDWTFTDAQRGDFTTIKLYTGRLIRAMRDIHDPRPDMIYHYTIGQLDDDRVVEAYQEIKEESFTSSDTTHLWHRHDSFIRLKCGDFWAMWAALTIDMGWTVDDWRKSLPATQPKPPTTSKPPAVSGLPVYAVGTRVLEYKKPNMKGTDVRFVQKWIGPDRMGTPDGIAGPKFDSGVKWYQGMRGLKKDGEVGPITWRQMGVRWRG